MPTAPGPVGSYLHGAELAAEIRGSGPVVPCSGNTQSWCNYTPRVPVWEAMSNTGQEGRLEWSGSPGEDRGQGTEALSIALIFDGASSGSTRAQWVELALFLEIVAW